MLVPFLATVSLSTSCSQGGFLQKSQAQKVLNATCQLREGLLINWTWCGDNIVAGSSVSQVCLGNATYTDHSSTILRFSSQEKNSEECWYSTDSAKEETATSECNQIYVRKYEKEVATRIKTTEVVECYQEGLVLRVSGSLGGPREEFVAKRPSPK